MKLYKHIRFDLTYGLFRREMWPKYIIWLGFFTLVSFNFAGELASMEATQYTYGDYLLRIFGGMREYVPTQGDPFDIPYLWLINHIGILYFTLHYMHDDLEGIGCQMILRSGSRTEWWLSKCIWNTAAVVLLYTIAWGTIFLLAASNHAILTFEISPFMEVIMVPGPCQLAQASWQLTLEITILPLLATLAMSQVQMLLCLVVRPAISYVTSLVIFLSSAYKLSPFLPGNYAIALRSDKIISNGVSGTVGIGIYLFLILASVVMGSVLFHGYNILSKED